MSGDPLVALVERESTGAVTVRSPAVGLFADAPANGSLVGAGGCAGALVRLGRRHALVLPESAEGRVAVDGSLDRSRPVAYGDPLFRIEPLAPAARRSGAPKGAKGASAGSAVTAPTAGVFYRSPSAGARPYVAAGDRVTQGQPVGLIEVMKTFNPIAYGGAGLPDEATVVEVLARDGEEVRAGQPLVLVR